MSIAHCSRDNGIDWLADGPIGPYVDAFKQQPTKHRYAATTTHRYVKADLTMKEKALGLLEAPDTKMRRYSAPDSLMRFRQKLKLCGDFPGPDGSLPKRPAPAPCDTCA
ncbi:MAG: hypothetical protein ABI135_05355 [Rhodoferax sp.]